VKDKLKILFLHGKEGTPEGSKPTFMREIGHRVIAPVLPKGDWELSVRRAYDCLDAFQPDVIVGSSRGGAIACAIEAIAPKILIAPAYRNFHVNNPVVDKTTVILHCPEDSLVKFEDSSSLTESFGCKLIPCGENHRMSDEEALMVLKVKLRRIANESR
jgi:hypothetical protein